MTEEQEFSMIKVTNETKELFEKERQKIPYENSQTQDTFIQYLLLFHKENKKK